MGRRHKKGHGVDDTDGQGRSLKNIKWLGHYLGVSRNTVHQWVKDGHVPHINLGVDGGRRIIRFDPQVIDEWLLKRSFTPKQEKEDISSDPIEDEIE